MNKSTVTLGDDSIGMASVQSQGSSKAVLAALRALQDKIRRLETERAQALDECNHLRNQIRSQEMESEHVKQRDTLNNQKTLLEAKAAYDKLSQEKTNMTHQLAELADKNRDSERLVDKMKDKIAALEVEKDDLAQKKRTLDEEQRKADQMLEDTKRREQELTHALVGETEKYQNELDGAKDRLQGAMEELRRVNDEKISYEAKLSELDSVVAQLLKVNERLVAQLQGKYSKKSGSPFKAAAAAAAAAQKVKGTKKKVTKTKKASTVKSATAPSSALTLSTAASRGHSTRPASSPAMDGAYLEELHKVYVSMAHDVISGKRASEALSSKSVGALPTKKKIKKKSVPKSRIGQRREARSAAKASSSTARTLAMDDSDSGADEYEGDDFVEGTGGRQQLHVHMPGAASSSRVQLMGPDLSRTSTDTHDADLKNAISELENEFSSLNEKYKGLLHGMDEGAGDNVARTRDLVTVIEKMHDKGDKLRALKSPTYRGSP